MDKAIIMKFLKSFIGGSLILSGIFSLILGVAYGISFWGIVIGIAEMAAGFFVYLKLN